MLINSKLSGYGAGQANSHQKSVSNQSSLETVNYNNHKIRVISDDQGNTWWVAKDVCEILGQSNHKVAIEMLDEDEVNFAYFVNALG